jgi:hypothetical protein
MNSAGALIVVITEPEEFRLETVFPETPYRTSLSSKPQNPGLKCETWATHLSSATPL